MRVFIFILLTVLLLATGCTARVGQNSERGDENAIMSESEEMAQLRLRLQEHREKQNEERMRTTVGYILRGDYTSANKDIDLNRIERFVFFVNINDGGYSFVLDKTHNRVYYDPQSAMIDMLEYVTFSAEFKDEDLERLIKVIEESSLRDWKEFYNGENDPNTTASFAWALGILFDDGTMLRRGGSGAAGGSPPTGQFQVLLEFVKTIGEEIEKRHNAEQALME